MGFFLFLDLEECICLNQLKQKPTKFEYLPYRNFDFISKP